MFTQITSSPMIVWGTIAFMTPELRNLIKRAQKSDPSAVTRLYEMHVDQIYRFIAYRVPTTADAEDLASEVFLNMLSNLGSYQVTGAPFEAWLYQIASRRVADFYRKRSRRPQVEMSDNLEDSKPSPEERVSERMEFQTLRGALGQLPEEHQTVLILRFIEGKSHQEVAEVIDKSLTAVRSIQHRALVELTRLLGSEDKVRHYLRGGGHV
jgi:RNA polymerase sigma-70 factor (ECF subfamily)